MGAQSGFGTPARCALFSRPAEPGPYRRIQGGPLRCSGPHAPHSLPPDPGPARTRTDTATDLLRRLVEKKEGGGTGNRRIAAESACAPSTLRACVTICAAPRPRPAAMLGAGERSRGACGRTWPTCFGDVCPAPGHVKAVSPQGLPPAFGLPAPEGRLRALWYFLSKLSCAKAKALAEGLRVQDAGMWLGR